MKLRNKKTGEIVCARFCGVTYDDDDDHLLKMWLRDDDNEYEYNSLAELNEEWEDYVEPKVFYWINYDGSISHAEKGTMSFSRQKQIGNYFETKEEAERAVEKLKAWKRLQDKGISFEVKVIDRRWYLAPKAEPQQRTIDESHDLVKDIMFIFGGEE